MRASFPIHSVKQPTIPVVIARSQRARAKSRGPMTGSATKQSRAAELDCFATLAMTKPPLYDSLPAHKGSGTPADAYEMSAPAGAVRATVRSACADPPLRARSPVGVPPRFSPEGLSSPVAQLQARLPGTWPERLIRYARPNRGAEILRFSAGVTRAYLSQPSGAPHTPVIVPGG